MLHSKRADVVCLEEECHCLICPDCGLFGEHKHHHFISADSLESKCKDLTMSALEVVEQLKEREEELGI